MKDARKNPVYRRRLLMHRIGITLSVLAMAFGIFFLLWILATLFINGFGAISAAMFAESTPAPGSDGGGLLNAIVGSLLMVGIATAVSTPIGILAGIYLAEYGEQSRFAQLTRFVTDIMLSAPSIVIGLFVYSVYVAHIKHFSGWAGSFAIALIAIPVVVRTTDNMLDLVPTSLREAAFALGAPRWKVTLRVVLPTALPGILTGSLLAVARAAGETAPLLFTATVANATTLDLGQRMNSLPALIYQNVGQPRTAWCRSPGARPSRWSPGSSCST
jgi:phosphate transport system permease protein